MIDTTDIEAIVKVVTPLGKAYCVSNDDYTSKIVFAESEVEALELSEDGETAKREEQYDEFAEQGWVPPLLLIADGWWLHCDWCDRRTDDEEEEDDDGNVLPVIDPQAVGQFVFCCEPCQSEWAEERAIVKAKKEEAIAGFKSALPYPEIEVLCVWTHDSVRVDFTFPDRKGLIPKWNPDSNVISISPCDLEAFERIRGKPAVLCCG